MAFGWNRSIVLELIDTGSKLGALKVIYHLVVVLYYYNRLLIKKVAYKKSVKEQAEFINPVGHRVKKRVKCVHVPVLTNKKVHN